MPPAYSFYLFHTFIEKEGAVEGVKDVKKDIETVFSLGREFRYFLRLTGFQINSL